MRIVVLHGQSHKGSTYHLAKLFCDKLGGEVTEFFLPRDFGAFCVGCSQCFSKSEQLCPHADQLRPITEALDAADVIVLASPVYVYHVTGPMKALLDRLCKTYPNARELMLSALQNEDQYGLWNRPQEGMFFKQAVCLSTAAGAGTRRTNQDLADSAFFWGIAKIHRYGRNVRAVSWEQVSQARKDRMARELSTLAKRVERGVGKVRPGLRTKAFFTLIRWMQKRGWNEADQVYWREKGWTGRARPWRKA